MMRILFALWLFANACHGRFNAEAPSLIEKMVAVGNHTSFPSPRSVFFSLHQTVCLMKDPMVVNQCKLNDSFS